MELDRLAAPVRYDVGQWRRGFLDHEGLDVLTAWP